MIRSDVCPGVSQAVAVPVAEGAAEAPAESRLAALFDAHHMRLYRLARRMSSNTDDARDLVQETFLRAARAAHSVPQGEAAEEAWLVRVLINICRDGWRRRATRTRLDAVGRTAAPRTDPEAAFVARRTIWRALESLPPRRRAAIVMYELEGAGIPDIATLLGVSAVTVRWHLSRGRRELARVIRGLDSAGER